MRKIKQCMPFLLGLVIALIIAGFLIPVRLEVTINPEKLDDYEAIEREDLTVYLSPLFRQGKEVNDFHFEKVSDGGYYSLIVQHTIFYKSIRIKNEALSELTAVYEGEPHEGDSFDQSNIKVTASLKDGTTRDVTDFTVIGNPDKVTMDTDVVIRTEFGSTKLDILFQPMKGIVAEYTETAYEGESFEQEAVSVSLEYEDGTLVPVEVFDCEGETTFRGRTNYTVYTSYGTGEFAVEPIPIKDTIATSTYTEGDVFDGEIQLEYEDDHTNIIQADDVEFEDLPTLEYGVNAFPFKWKKSSYTLYVAAEASTPVSEAQKTLQNEIENSLYNELTKNLYLTVNRMGSDRPFYVTHIVLSHPDQLYVEGANGGFETGLETPENAAKRTGWTLGINGSFFDTLAEMPSTACMIRNKQIISSGDTTGYEVCITDTGNIFSPPSGVSAQALLDAGVKDILFTTDPLLLQDGHVYSEGDTTTGGSYPRTAVGMVKPGEYYFLTTDTGLTYSEMQSVFAELGCTYARSLDGGSSVALYYKKQAVNNTSNRAVADFLCVREKR